MDAFILITCLRPILTVTSVRNTEKLDPLTSFQVFNVVAFAILIPDIERPQVRMLCFQIITVFCYKCVTIYEMDP